MCPQLGFLYHLFAGIVVAGSTIDEDGRIS